MKKKWWLYIGVGIIFILFTINIIASFYFYDMAIERNKKDFLQDNADLEVSAEAMTVFTKGDWRDWYRDQNLERWEMESFDGLTLNGYYLEAEEPTNKTVVFAHGYLGRASDMAIFGKHYVEQLGYNMFTPDLRGHGDSEGDYIGFGWHDRIDLIDWLDRVIAKVGPSSEIILQGVSMGAATVLMASGEALPPNVKAIVSDSGYTSVDELFKYQAKRMFHLPSFPIIPTTSLVTNMKAGYTFKVASALEQVKKAEVPILYIHGESDTFVPTEMSTELYEHTNSKAEIVFFPDSNHGEAIAVHEEAYLNKLFSFLNLYIGK